MAGRLEKTYGILFKSMVMAVNPFKSAITQPECIIHQFINIQALEILKNDNYLDAHLFFSDYIAQLNDGVVWADQDMKSSGHFYHPEKERGLYGNNDALSLAAEYYRNALSYWRKGHIEKALFYLGASVHLVQDVSVPQHANNRLLDDHRRYELFVRKIFRDTPEFWTYEGGYYVNSIEDAVRFNARFSIKVYNKLKYIKSDEQRFYALTKVLLPLAQKTTAGCFMKFYKDTAKSVYSEARESLKYNFG